MKKTGPGEHSARPVPFFSARSKLFFVLMLVRNHLSSLRVVFVIVLMGVRVDHIPMAVLVIVNILCIL
ncbi:MAG: hypothetical protein ACLFSY_00060 [Desulfonatronovibrionaceae bacterium]